MSETSEELRATIAALRESLTAARAESDHWKGKCRSYASAGIAVANLFLPGVAENAERKTKEDCQAHGIDMTDWLPPPIQPEWILAGLSAQVERRRSAGAP